MLDIRIYDIPLNAIALIVLFLFIYRLLIILKSLHENLQPLPNYDIASLNDPIDDLVIDKSLLEPVENKMKICVITGGCGFLGSHIVEEVMKHDYHKIIVFDLSDKHIYQPVNHSLFSPGKKMPKVEYVKGDITNLNDVLKVIKGSTTVIHTASCIDLRNGVFHNRRMRKINVGGTWNIIKACLIHNVKSLVYTSSSSIIGGNKSFVNIDEVDFEKHLKNQPPSNQSYRRTKREATELVLKATKALNLNACVLVPHILFGPGDQLLTRNILDQNECLVDETNTSENSIVYIESLAKAHYLASNALLKDPKKISGQLYLIGDFNLQYKEFFATCCNVLGSDLEKKKNVFYLVDIFILISKLYDIFNGGKKNSPFLQLTSSMKSYLAYSISYAPCQKAMNDLNWEPMKKEVGFKKLKSYVNQHILKKIQ